MLSSEKVWAEVRLKDEQDLASDFDGVYLEKEELRSHSLFYSLQEET